MRSLRAGAGAGAGRTSWADDLAGWTGISRVGSHLGSGDPHVEGPSLSRADVRGLRNLFRAQVALDIAVRTIHSWAQNLFWACCAMAFLSRREAALVLSHTAGFRSGSAGIIPRLMRAR